MEISDRRVFVWDYVCMCPAAQYALTTKTRKDQANLGSPQLLTDMLVLQMHTFHLFFSLHPLTHPCLLHRSLFLQHKHFLSAKCTTQVLLRHSASLLSLLDILGTRSLVLPPPLTDLSSHPQTYLIQPTTILSHPKQSRVMNTMHLQAPITCAGAIN